MSPAEGIGQRSDATFCPPNGDVPDLLSPTQVSRIVALNNGMGTLKRIGDTCTGSCFGGTVFVSLSGKGTYFNQL